MAIPVKSARLLNTVFVHGTNFKETIGGTKGETLEYSDGMLKMTYKGSTAMIPMSNVANFVIEDRLPAVAISVPHPQIANIGSAQVSTPHDHVFRGLGEGQTGQQPPKPKKGQTGA